MLHLLKMERNNKGQFIKIKPILEQKKVICNCGCNQETNFLDKYGRPRKYILGHNANIKEFKEMIKELNKGKTAWNKNLTKETDERIKEASKKMSISNKGNIPWNKNKKGLQKAWNKNLTKETSESVRKISKSKMGHDVPEIVRQKIRETLLLKQEEGFVSRRDYKNFTRYIKNLIRKRDNQVCMLCGIHREKLKHPLDCHHINYDKYLSIEQNLITLCKTCHGKVGFNKKHWVKFFQSVLSERYGYKYGDSGEVILELETNNEK